MVLVSHKHNFVFLKTSKTAGTTVEMALEPLCTPNGHVVREVTPPIFSKEGIVGRRLLPRKSPSILYRRWNRWSHHMPAETLARELGPARWQAYSKLTVIRNPFDRAVSQFHWKLRGDPVLIGPFQEKRESFASFLRSEKFKSDREIVFIGDEFVPDETIRFESLQDDIEAIASKYDLPIDLQKLAHTKSTAGKRGKVPVSDYFEPTDREQLLKLMSWVFERFHYSTDPRDADAL